MTTPGRWSAQAERAGLSSVGVIDRLIYENLDPLVALAAAAASTSRVELVTTVVNLLAQAVHTAGLAPGTARLS